MTVTWLALAAALVLVPVPTSAALRARALAARVRPGPAPTVGSPPAGAAAIVSGPAGGATGAGPRPVAGRGRRRLALLGAIGLALAVATTVAFGPGLGLAVGVAALSGAQLARWARAAQLTRIRREHLLAAVRLLGSEVEAGTRPAEALAAAGAVAPAFREQFAAAGRAAEAGAPVAGGLLATADLAPLGHAWQLSEAGGAPLGEVLAGVAADLAARDETRRAVAAAVAGARSSAGLLAGLPLLGIGLGAAMGARPLAFLTGSPAGHASGCAGVVLEAAGLLWTQQLVRSAQGGGPAAAAAGVVGPPGGDAPGPARTGLDTGRGGAGRAVRRTVRS